MRLAEWKWRFSKDVVWSKQRTELLFSISSLTVPQFFLFYSITHNDDHHHLELVLPPFVMLFFVLLYLVFVSFYNDHQEWVKRKQGDIIITTTITFLFSAILQLDLPHYPVLPHFLSDKPDDKGSAICNSPNQNQPFSTPPELTIYFKALH